MRRRSVKFVAMMVVCSLSGISACSIFDPYEKETVPVDRFELVSVDGKEAVFQLFGTWRNTCGSVARFHTERIGQSYTVEMIGKQKRNAVCGEALTEIDGTWTGRVNPQETWIFRFRSGQNATLDTTIVIPSE